MLHSSKSIKNDHDYNHDRFFALPLSEQDALQLQAVFINCGVHVVKMKNIIEGRKIVKTILHSLNYFHNIGCISNYHHLPVFVCDIIKHIEFEKLGDDLLDNLEHFLTIHPCFDFIWFEFSQVMQKKYTLQNIQNIFEMYHVKDRMPVVIIVYDEE